MREREAEFEAAGVRLAVVVQARAEQAREVCGEDFPFACVPDADHAYARAVGLERMRPWNVKGGIATLTAQRRAARAGHKQDWKRSMRSESDTMLNPGAMLVRRGGEVAWLYRGKHVSDLPSADELLDVIRTLAPTL